MSRWLSIGTIGLIVGMGFSTWVPFQASSLTLLFLVGTIISVTLFPSRTNILSSVFAFLTLFGGVTLYATHFERWQTLSETIEYRGQVEIIERRDTNVFYRPILLRPIEKTWKGGDILYSAPIDFEQIPGEQGLLDCTLSRPKNFEAGFDYRNLLASRGTGYVCEKNGEFELLSREEFSLREKIFWLQSQFRRLITELVPEPEAGLLTGLLLGGSGTLAPETKDAFARAGLSHIVAVSGYNMSLVAEGFILLALIFGAWRKWAVTLAILGLGFFLLIIDGSAASLRAALMALLAFGAYFFGRPTASWNGLLLAGTVMLLFNPLLIRYDVGFQLSFLATVALLVFVRSFETFAFFRHWYGKVSALFLTTLVIELFTLPITTSTFGTFSLVAPFANALVLPLVPIAMGIGAFAIFLTSLLPGASFLLMPLVWLPLSAIIRLGETLGSWNWSTLTGLDTNPSFAVLWYVGIGLAVYFLERLRKRYVLGMDQ